MAGRRGRVRGRVSALTLRVVSSPLATSSLPTYLTRSSFLMDQPPSGPSPVTASRKAWSSSPALILSEKARKETRGEAGVREEERARGGERRTNQPPTPSSPSPSPRVRKRAREQLTGIDRAILRLVKLAAVGALGDLEAKEGVLVGRHDDCAPRHTPTAHRVSPYRPPPASSGRPRKKVTTHTHLSTRGFRGGGRVAGRKCTKGERTRHQARPFSFQ